jgi:hypothetical protein
LKFIRKNSNDISEKVLNEFLNYSRSYTIKKCHKVG